MDTPIATCADDICGGGSDAMVVKTDEDDLFHGVDEESREFCFSWAADYESRTIIVGDGDRTVLPSPPSKNVDVTPKTQEQISRAQNTRPPTRVYNFNDLFSPSRPTVAVSHPSNDDQGRVRMDTGMEPPRQDVPEVIPAAPEEQARERQKRIRWTKDEHKLFLMGYKKFDRRWTKVSRHYIPWKKPTQIASHAQKYFERQLVPIEKRIKNTVNNFSSRNLTPKDYSRLAPHRRPPPATRSNGGPTSVQQSLHAAMQESNTARSSSMQRPALLQQSFGVPMQGGNIRGFSRTWYQTDAGGHSSSHLQPLPHLGVTQRNHPSPTFYPGVDALMGMPNHPVAASPEYYHQAPPTLWNNNINLDPPVQHPSSYTEGLFDLFTVPSDYRADYGFL